VDAASADFVQDPTVCRPSITEKMIIERFQCALMPKGSSSDVIPYAKKLLQDVVADSMHTSSPQMIGHMTSALPGYMQALAKLIVAMNQNVVKTETAKSTTFLEREALAQLHRILYNNTDEFYEVNIQNPEVMLGLLTSGGTLANTTALWLARNSRLGPDGVFNFKGVQVEGMPRAMKHYDFEDIVIVGSALMHYSMDKTADLLGLGQSNLVKIPVDSNYQVDLIAMEDYLIKARERKVLVLALVGICGATETGAIDPLQALAELATKYSIHFHVDAAWGGPVLFSNSHRHKALGIERADTITLDGHKQLWVPMGCGLVFLKDPSISAAIRKTANYIIRKDSFDLGKFTIDGSRGAQAMYLHANLHVLGTQGFEVLIDRTIRVAKYMARCIMRSINFELLVKPMTNILLYRWLPARFRSKFIAGTLTDEDNAAIDEANQRLQELQKDKGKTFVSRTTINCPKYDLKPLVALRVVIGNPLTKEADIDAVFADQDSIVHGSDFDVTSDPAHIIERRPSIASSMDPAGYKNYWEGIWADLNTSERQIFNNDIVVFFDVLTTPDCFVDQEPDSPAKVAVIKRAKLRASSEADLVEC
jgi:glutamate decarboxylase